MSNLAQLIQEIVTAAGSLPSDEANTLRNVASALKVAQMPNQNNDAQFVLENFFDGDYPGLSTLEVLQETAPVRAEQWQLRNQRSDSYQDFVKPSQDAYVFASTKVAKTSILLPKIEKLLSKFVTNKSIALLTEKFHDSDAVVGVVFKKAEALDPVYDVLEKLGLEEIFSAGERVEFG